MGHTWGILISMAEDTMIQGRQRVTIQYQYLRVKLARLLKTAYLWFCNQTQPYA